MTPEEQASLENEARAVEGEVVTAAEQRDGRPPADEPSSNEPTTAEVLTALLVPTFRFMAPAWEVTDGECALLGDAYGAVLDKYLPDFNVGVELSAALATLAVFGPRWGKPTKATPKKEQAPPREATPG